MSTRSLTMSLLQDDLLPRRFLLLPCFPFHLFNKASATSSLSSPLSKRSSVVERLLSLADILSSSLVHMLFNQQISECLFLCLLLVNKVDKETFFLTCKKRIRTTHVFTVTNSDWLRDNRNICRKLCISFDSSITRRMNERRAIDM